MVRTVSAPQLRVYWRDDDDLPEPPPVPRSPRRRPWDSAVRKRVINKPVSFSVPLEDWQRLRAYAARRKLTLTGICRQLLEPAFQRLREGRELFEEDEHSGDEKESADGSAR